jgi:hypothetical protein
MQQMKVLNTKLVLSAVGLVLLATPAFAQWQQRQQSPRALYNYQDPQPYTVGVYPNGAIRSGSAESVQSGAEFNLDRGY